MCERFDLKEDAVIGMLGIGYHRWLEIGGTVELVRNRRDGRIFADVDAPRAHEGVGEYYVEI